MNWVEIFLSPRGRIGNRLYAAAIIAVIAVQIFSLALPIIGWVVFPLLNYPGICLTIKRLHDCNRSGIWVIAPYAIIAGYLLILSWYAIITLGGFGTFSGGSSEDQRTGRALADMAVYILFLMPAAFLTLISLIPGSRERNRYGMPRPRHSF